ncbi:hypothetical protein [Bosea sp. (in: a-proteobacteria)]|uniref:hypothetical protein n=1 Tax=Bosea sp. (in: a-proteobacteria) TaxID=1871050 RepID=UPI001218FE11|nr:hypothetical protein [Bosea sp. (in: a-proteobacteria)]TAJ31175.1 MAG: hypothetical protein EPO59_08785 [Bosea sp. (in: a-proteobacteria)]
MVAIGEISTGRPRAGVSGFALRCAASPYLWIAAFVAVAVAALSLPLRLPLGPNAWDTVVYLDALQRIRTGQAPGLDFFAPVGPLGYYLMACLDRLFPQAQPMLLANWALLPVLLPLVALMTGDLAQRRPGQALALLLPFLLFAALPVNLHSLYPSPGLDGYGHYNRQICLLLYLLIAALLFVKRRGLRIGLVSTLMLSLFLVKITGALVGTLLVGYALLVGRMRFVDVVIAAGLTILSLGGIELATGLVSAYLSDVFELVALNTGDMLPRFLTVASVKFNVIAPLLVLLATLALVGWRDGLPSTRSDWRAWADSPLCWLAIAFAALAFFETQNSGSLEFIGLWPILLLLLTQWWLRVGDPLRPVVLLLLMATVLPSLMIYVERSGRALIAAPAYAKLDLPELGPLGRFSVKPEIATRAAHMLDHYAAHQATYNELVAADLGPSHILASEIDYQATWLLEIRQAVRAIARWEAEHRRRLNAVFTLDFVDPMNYLLNRPPPREVPIGPDPSRTTPVLTRETLTELGRTDAILIPKCPPTPEREALRRHFAPALAGRDPVALAPCWDMYLRK